MKIKFDLKVRIMLVIIIAGLFVVPASYALTRTITSSSDDVYTSIVCSNGNIYEATFANLQTAIYSLNSTNGGWIKLPNMDETFTDMIRVIGNLTIIGNGKYSTRLRFDDHLAADSASFISLEYVDNVTIRDLYIDGNKDGQVTTGPFDYDFIHTIDVQYSSNITIENVCIVDGFTAGIHTANSRFININKCDVYESSDDAIAINQYTRYAWVTECTINGSGMNPTYHYGEPNGIEIQDDTHFVFCTKNYISNTQDKSIAVNAHLAFLPCSDILIEGNIIENQSLKPLIYIAGTTTSGEKVTNVTVSNNMLTFRYGGLSSGTNSNAIQTTGATQGINILNNNINGRGCGTYGLLIYGNNNFISGNNIHNITGASPRSGITLATGCDNITITSNIIYDCGRGIEVYGNNSMVTNNRIYDTRLGTARSMTYGISVPVGSNNSYISGNFISNTKTYDIYCLGRNNTLIYNNFKTFFMSTGGPPAFQNKVYNKVGFKTETSGNRTVPLGSTGEISTIISFAHNLSTTPHWISITIGGNSTCTNGNEGFNCSMTATKIWVQFRGTLVNNCKIYWEARSW